MRHRLQRVFVRRRSPQKSRTTSTFTTNSDGDPHSARKNKLHSKSTYFYNDGSSRLSSKLNYVVPSVCTLTLLVGGMVCINPTLDNRKVYAEELDFDASNADSTSNDSGIMTASDPTINLTIAPDSGNTNSNVTVGEVAYFSNTITVGGTGISKYYLTLSTPSGSTGNLVGKDHPAATVGKVTYNTAPANFNDNTWGYAVSDNTSTANNSLTYNPVPSGTSGNNSAYLAAKNSAPATDGDKYKLVFAAKLGSNLPGDHYQSSVYISAVANAEQTVNNWFRNVGITTMQEMNSILCKSAPENATSQLKDDRDGKLYWVTKLKDGNCWMTQNLAYDGGGTEQCTLSGGTDCTSWPSNNDYKPHYAKGTHSEAGESAHTAQGNFYSWEAAMDGNTGVPGSVQGICPNNWQLPTSNSANSKSFDNLANAYGIGNNASGSRALRSNPLFFQYGGYVGNGKLSGADVSGYYWSSTPNGTNNAYRLLFTDTNVVSYLGGNRYDGYSVRCVAK